MLGHVNVVWRFVAGLTRLEAIGWEVFKRRNMKVEGRVYIDRGYAVGDGVVRVWPSVVQYLYEAQDTGSCTGVVGQSRVEYRGGGCNTPSDAFAVGYCVSLCGNNWNVELMTNGLGPEMVEMLAYGLKSVQYGGGLVEKLRLSCNPIRDEGVKYFQQFPHQILQQIKTLDLSYCDIGQKGFDLLADILPLLSSLELLNISHNPGGNRCAVKLFQALGEHQTIEHLRTHYTVIGRDDVMTLCEVVQPSGSLREIYIGSANDMSSESVQQLGRMVLSPSSLKKLKVMVPSSVSPLDYTEAISNR